MKNTTKVIVPFIITTIVGGILFFFALPALNLQSFGFWLYLIVLLFIFEGLLIAGGNTNLTKKGYKLGGVERAGGIAVALVILAFAIMIIGSSRMLNSEAYASLLKDDIKEADFAAYQATLSNVPLLDKDSAIQISNRELGSLVDVVSQFELGPNEQITLMGKSVRVSPLYYGSFFKWNNNRNEGTPGYIKIDMMNQEAELVRLAQGIRYSPSEFFGRDLTRYLRGKYPAAIFSSYNFELDEEGSPFWVVPVEKHTIGLFGGTEVDYVLLVNAITGDIIKHSVEETPEWVDNVYNSELIISQYDDYGSLQNGYWNSIFGHKGVKVTTEGYNYIPQGNDNWIYTGVTSAGRDESNIGFILSNKRTKETIYYPISGAEEYSAMSSAEGVVQHLGYTATFPLLLKVEGQPTYMMALKDAGGLVRMYGMVNVEKYQIVATGDTVQSCQQKYRELLKNNSMTITEAEVERVSGLIESIKTAAMDGTTYYYIKLANNDAYFVLSVKDNQQVVLKDLGDTITLDVDRNSKGILRNALMIE